MAVKKMEKGGGASHFVSFSVCNVLCATVMRPWRLFTPSYAQPF